MCYSQLLIGFATGILTSVIGGWLLIRCQTARFKQRQAEKYGKMAGKYQGFTFQPSDARKLSPKPASRAEITYIEANLLKIHLDHDNRSWEGIITMEIEQYGSIVWKYLNSIQEEYEFGFKRCIVNSPDEIYLIGEKFNGYDKEVLKRITS